MKKMLFCMAVVLPICCLFSCHKPPVAPELTAAEQAEMIAQGKAASAALFGELVPKLQAAMLAGGPVAAIGVCKEAAPITTGKVSATFPDLQLTRVALKARNPANQCDTLDRSVLREWEALQAADKPLPEAIIKRRDATMAIFYKPIIVGGACLKCHGDPATFSVGLKEQLSQLYPDDQATGYQLGDLRGAFRAEFLLPSR